MSFKRSVLFSIVPLFLLASAQVDAATPPPAAAAAAASPQHTLIWRGDIVSARAFAVELGKDFEKQKRGKITAQAFSTVSGIDAVIAGSADVAGSARPMHSSREEEAGLVFDPIALDAVVAITHPGNPVTNLSLTQIRQLYLGRIKNWSELGGKDMPINLYSIAAPLDGIEQSVRALLFKSPNQRIAAPRLYMNTSKLEEGVAIDPAGLGLSSLSNAYANKGVKMLAVEGVNPSTQSIANGSYPLYNTLYVVHRQDNPNAEAVTAFLDFLRSAHAGDVMRKHQLVPWTEVGDIAQRDSERLVYIEQRIAVTPPSATPVSAVRATLESQIANAPGAASTQQAHENVRRAEAQKNQDAAEPATQPR